MGVPALPIPTGGATHVFEIIAVLVAVQLVVGRKSIRIPKRWREISLGAGAGRERFTRGLLRFMRFLERFSRPRLALLFRHRFSNQLFGLSVILFCVAAFFAPPFSGLDTLPALGVVLISIAVLLEDFAFVLAGLAIGCAGIVLEITLGRAVADAIKDLV